MIFGLLLLAIGVIALLVKLDILEGSIWGYTWPTLLIIIGLYFILGRFTRRASWISNFGPCWFWSHRKEMDREREDKF